MPIHAEPENRRNDRTDHNDEPEQRNNTENDNNNNNSTDNIPPVNGNIPINDNNNDTNDHNSADNIINYDKLYADIQKKTLEDPAVTTHRGVYTEMDNTGYIH